MEFSVMLNLLIEGTVMTAEIFFVTLVLSLPLGMFVCFGRMSKNIIVRSFFKFYISVMRGTPLMLQLMVFYFGPFYLFGMQITDMWKQLAWILGFSLNYAAYFAEIYRGGIESMPQGQYEAAKILGYSKSQTFIRIILPQVIKRVMPSITNEAITLVKDTSLAFTLSIMELFNQAKALAARETNMIPYAIAALIYYVFCLLVAFVMEQAEKKMSYYR